jgi:hypothetical protein
MTRLRRDCALGRGIQYAAPSIFNVTVPEYWIVHPGAQWRTRQAMAA